jgi:hypothetical protein
VITNLKNGARPEIAQHTAGDEPSQIVDLYDLRGDNISLDEMERIPY